MIDRMEEELNSGQMELNTRENTKTGKRKGKEFYYLQMDLNMKEHLNKMIFTGMENIHGLINGVIREIG